MGFQNAKEHVPHGFGSLVILIWKSFGNSLEIFLKEFFQILVIRDMFNGMVYSISGCFTSYSFCIVVS